MTTNPPLSASASPALSKRQIAFAALRHRDYRRYFFVIMLSQMGDNIEHVISYWLLFQKFHSPALGDLRSSVIGRPRYFLRFILGRLPTVTTAVVFFRRPN